MKIIVLHGDNSAKLDERLNKFIEIARERSWDINRIAEGKSLPESLMSASLFGRESLYIFDKPETLGKREMDWLQNKSKKTSGTLVLYKDGVIGKTLLAKLPKDIRVEEFKLPKLLFNFLESFYPGNPTRVLELLHEITKNESIEFVFAILARHLRDIYWATHDSGTLSYPSWRIGKLKSQGTKFGDGKVSELISELAKIDIEVKTSKADLLSSLDLLIVTKLK